MSIDLRMNLTGKKNTVSARPVSGVELACAAAFAACNLIIPLCAGELYPFTVAPCSVTTPTCTVIIKS
jgi:hypothetical protein